MLSNIQSVLDAISNFFADVATVISSLWQGFLDIPHYVSMGFKNAGALLSWAFPSAIASTLFIIGSIVVIYKIFGRT